MTRTRGALLVLAIICLATAGFFAFTNGSSDIASVFHSPQLLKTDVQPNGIGDTPCDQAGTTTPCAQIEAQQAKEQAQAQTVAPKPQSPATPVTDYGPLTQTYTDAQYGFSIKYPAGFFMSDAGDGEVLENVDPSSDGEASVLIKIANPTDELASTWTGSTIASLADFEQSHSHVAGQDTHGPITEEFDPSEGTIFTTPNGLQILKQPGVFRCFDSQGKDVSLDCGVGQQITLYFLYKNPQNYFVFFLFDGNETATEKILDSINY